MPFRAKIQPIGGDVLAEETVFTPAVRQVKKSGLKKLFERPFDVKNLTGGDPLLSRDKTRVFEPSYVCPGEMVENYVKDSNSKKEQQRCSGLNLYNCSSGSGTDSSDEDSSDKELKMIGSLVHGTSSRERNLAMNVMEAVKTADDLYMTRHESRLQIVADTLVMLGYDALICRTSWKKSDAINCLAGEYAYLDVLIGGERLFINIDFKSKFEIARRPTKTYKSLSQSLPYIFVGEIDRLLKLVIVMSDAAKESFKKRKLHVPPWRRAEYMLIKWLSPHVRANQWQGETSGEGGALEPKARKNKWYSCWCF